MKNITIRFNDQARIVEYLRSLDNTHRMATVGAFLVSVFLFAMILDEA